jgi:HD-like signal output (HDOD) protein
VKPVTNPTTAAATPFDVEQALVAMIARDAVKVPPYPAVALRLQELVRREDYGLREVVNLVSGDPALAAEVIRCSNSAYYGGGEITALQPAINRVGATEVVRLALVSGLAATARSAGALTQVKRRCWQDSVASALVCQMIAKHRGLAPDDAFLCGLLHDFGWLLGLSGLEEIIAAHPTVAPRDSTGWAEMVERLHLELGLVLAARWELPALLNDAISLHHEPGLADSPHAAMIAVVKAADQVVALLGQNSSISAETLTQATALSATERVKLAASLPDIPSVIAAFEGEPVGRPVASKVIAQPAPAAPEELVPCALPLRLHSPKRVAKYTLRAVGEALWEMSGKEQLPEGLLIEAAFGEEKTAVRLWAKSTLCVAEPGGYKIQCKPFLLNAALQAKWQQVFIEAKAPPAAKATPKAAHG